MKRVVSLSALSFVAALALGCSPDFERLEFTLRSDAPLPVTLSSTQISLPVGVAVDVQLHPIAGGEEMKNARVELRSSAPSVLKIDGRFGSTDLVISGQGEGKAEIQVIIDGEAKTTLAAAVTPQ